MWAWPVVDHQTGASSPSFTRQGQLLRRLLRHRHAYAVIHACDFDTLTAAVILKLVYGKRVVYDIFDGYADAVRGLPGVLRRCLARLDRWLLEKVDAVILADESRLPQLGKAARAGWRSSSTARTGIPTTSSAGCRPGGGCGWPTSACCSPTGDCWSSSRSWAGIRSGSWTNPQPPVLRPQ